ncbi:hypothetical protein LXM50_12510 [Microbacterium sp. Au-Mic1]|uniref:hypothetical protein n=1 Tax=Microbacterium sp. Au-Mic1 TaxID=2906457 RepID=UPI001E5B3E66|nr:hypothetical protein [Microbacterium sp. Au-Mic1]MCE4026792.1 hypothetical protein [Microbacterium sp. Au-Mic1]
MTPAGRAGRLMEPLRAGIAVVLVATAVGLVGCTPGPAPKPTPTPLFTSEAEAFKAAEQVYRDYNEASNERREGKEDVDPQSFLSGQALDDDINAQRMFKEKHLKIVGPNRVSSFDPIDYDQARGQISANLCVDVTQSRVVDDSGADVTPSTRAGLVALHVTMTERRDHLEITSAVAGEHSCRP